MRSILNILASTLLALSLSLFGQDKPSPKFKAPTPGEVSTAVQMLQSQTKTQSQSTLPPIEVHRDPAPAFKEVPPDFKEHKSVALPPTAQQALVTGMPWSTQLNSAAVGKDGRVLYTFGEGLPVLVCSPLRICVVELEAGEQFSGAPHLGDSVRWDVSIETSGSGDSSHPVLVLKPKDAGLDTTLFVTTNKRSYYIRLIATQDVYTPIVAFSYPEEQQAQLARQISDEQQHRRFIQTTQVSQLPASVDEMYFDYAIRGDEALRPLRVMDDGAKTYIQMPEDVLHRELPTLAIEGPGGRELVNFRVKGTFYIVDRLFDKAVLLLGAGKHTRKVEIVRRVRHRQSAATTQTGGM